MKRKRKWKLHKLGPLLLHRLALLFFILCAALPLYWMINTSFKTQGEIYQKIPTLWPKDFTLANYSAMLSNHDFINSIKNSLFVALVVVVISIVVAFPVAYSLARKRFRGRKTYSKIILFSYLLPSSMMYLPLYIVAAKAGLTNSLMALLLLYPAFTLPYCCWILMPHVAAVPTSIEEAAVVDGCSKLGVMLRIVFRLSVSGIVSTAIFTFAMCWGEYLYALVNLSSEAQKTVPLIIAGLIHGDMYPWGQIMAGAVIACIPVFLLYVFSSGFLAGDRNAGGVKG